MVTWQDKPNRPPLTPSQRRARLEKAHASIRNVDIDKLFRGQKNATAAKKEK